MTTWLRDEEAAGSNPATPTKNYQVRAGVLGRTAEASGAVYVPRDEVLAGWLVYGVTLVHGPVAPPVPVCSQTWLSVPRA